MLYHPWPADVTCNLLLVYQFCIIDINLANGVGLHSYVLCVFAVSYMASGCGLPSTQNSHVMCVLFLCLRPIHYCWSISTLLLVYLHSTVGVFTLYYWCIYNLLLVYPCCGKGRSKCCLMR